MSWELRVYMNLLRIDIGILFHYLFFIYHVSILQCKCIYLLINYYLRYFEKS